AEPVAALLGLARVGVVDPETDRAVAFGVVPQDAVAADAEVAVADAPPPGGGGRRAGPAVPRAGGPSQRPGLPETPLRRGLPPAPVIGPGRRPLARDARLRRRRRGALRHRRLRVERETVRDREHAAREDRRRAAVLVLEEDERGLPRLRADRLDPRGEL